ncbi:hypothetical protein [Glutamicibacter sp. V16R2B1]|uniref:hypothetical protein n=1 Tax=Glutamicibacter sp. V16R2B1 TaxID=2036207 RepID=UPI0010FF0FFD|nr:hypothetical protein [Glutamicibacter sp. V16R2B1]MCK9901219.1 hypothetical protein [Frankia sp. Cpl3]TLK47507.1 hypothetical protein FDN03_15735 [Glutamicibacter sp. V16R2B1]
MTHISPTISTELDALRDLAAMVGKLVTITDRGLYTRPWKVTIPGIVASGLGTTLTSAAADLFEQLAVDVSLSLPDGRTVHWDWDASVWNVKAPAVAA